MAKKLKTEEKLPTGIDRLDSGTLRVRVRVRGREEATRSFPLHENTREARERQLHEATAWQAQTAAKVKSGMHISTREAEKLKLRDALIMLREEGLNTRNESAREIAQYQIGVLLKDPIADLPLAKVSKPDLAALRDRLIQRGIELSDEKALKRISKLEDKAERQQRLADLQSLPKLRKKLSSFSAHPASVERDGIAARIAQVEVREGIKPPASSTVKNTLGKVNVALKLIGQKVHGVAEPVRGVSMPKASPPRTRRPSKDEWERLLAAAEAVNPLCPLILRFAVLTALRRERCLTVRLSNISQIADGKQVIHFPKEDGSKKIGIIPVTTEIRAIIDQALAMRQDKSNDRLVFAVPIETFEAWFEKSLASAGIKDLHFHDLRHEATSRLFEQGLNMMEVMTITGHTTTEIVERYSHYNCGLIHDKLEKAHLKRSPESILEDIRVMVGRYLKAGGKLLSLKF